MLAFFTKKRVKQGDVHEDELDKVRYYPTTREKALDETVESSFLEKEKTLLLTLSNFLFIVS